MVEPTREDHGNSPVTRGVIIALALLILGFLALMIIAQEYETHWLVRTFRVVWYLLGLVCLLWWLTAGIVNFFKDRMRDRRERAERNEGLNGPPGQGPASW